MNGNLNEIRSDVSWITRFLSRDTRHYGLWNDEKGWWWCYMKVYATTSPIIAEAQLDAFNRDGMGWGKPDEYRVRCIEEWANGRAEA